MCRFFNIFLYVCSCYGWRFEIGRVKDVPSKRSWVASMTSILVASGISSTISVLPSHAVENNAPQTQVFGKTAVDGEANRVFMKARQIESDGDEVQAAKLYQQVVQAEPEFIYGWSNLGNVLSATGNLQQSLLCYKKAILLHPPKDMLSVILINKASVENALDHLDIAVNDLTVAESLAGPSQIILSNKATILSKAGNWKESCEIFEKIISSADRYALPWWLRYSMALLETDRGMESVAYLQRVLNRFPYETECKAYAAAVYNALGTKSESLKYWETIPELERQEYSVDFVQNKLKWGPVAVASFKNFLQSI